MGKDNKVRDTIDAATGLAKAVPIYQDAVQPAAKEIGVALQTVTRAIHVALAPVSALVWGYDQIKDFVSTRVAEKLQDVDPENIKSPPPNVVGPALEALRFTGHDPELRELYASLLATSLDANTCRNAHPAFVDIIKNMSPDEARIMRLFSRDSVKPLIDLRRVSKTPGDKSYRIVVSNFSFIGRDADCQHEELVPSYLDNLSRLGLLIPPDKGIGAPHLANESLYSPLESAASIKTEHARIQAEGGKPEILRCLISMSSLGEQFCQACVLERHAEASKEQCK